MSTQNKTVIVTGASRGIGAATARRLATDGLNVVLNYSSNGDNAKSLVAEIEAKSGRAVAVKGDVSRSAEFAAVFDAAEKAFGGVDVLVNNAGLMSNMPIAKLDEDAFDRMFAVNVRGVVNGSKLAANRLRHGGAIINLSTSVIGQSPPGYGSYCASKAAVEAISRSLSKEVGSRGIRVNCVAPGPTDTELLSNANSEDRLKLFVSMTPLGRLGQAQDTADVVAFLVSDDARWINGQTIRVNGGIVA